MPAPRNVREASDVRVARDVIDATAHVPEDMDGHTLDWPAMPAPFKAYPPGVPLHPLPRPASWPELSCGLAFSGRAAPPAEPGAALVSALLQLACGVTASVRRAVDEYYLRANASAGALYPCELYLAANGVDGLPDGLFHFAAERHALRVLRAGPALTGPGLAAWLTVIPFRSAWKYRARALRYLYLDAGHLLENLDCAARSLGLSCTVEQASDADANAALLGLDPARERCLVRVGLWGVTALAQPLPPPVRPELARASTVSPRETTYPLLQDVLEQPAASGPALPPAPPAPLEQPFSQAALARRSRRAYAPQPLPQPMLDALLTALRGPAGAEAGLGVRLLVQGEHGLAAGYFAFDRSTGALARLDLAPSPAALAEACLGQAWMTKAGVLICFTADLDAAEAAHGPGALGTLLLQAGRLGQRIALVAEALSATPRGGTQRLGACGVGAFYDAQASRLLGLGQAERLLYVTTFGLAAGR